MKTTATRRIQFCAGHRVKGHESKCANLHGHNYVAFIHATADSVDSIGRIIDFSVLKEKIGGWIDKNWDHTMILFHEDLETIRLCAKVPERNKEIFLLGKNPTAENMAEFLLKEICPEELKDTGVKVNKITLWETENCFAEVSLDD